MHTQTTNTAAPDDNVQVAVWSNAELTTAIFCATLSGIKPFVQWVSTRKSLSRQSYSFKLPGSGDIFNSGNRRDSKMTPGPLARDLGSEPGSSKLARNNGDRDATESEIELSSHAV